MSDLSMNGEEFRSLRQDMGYTQKMLGSMFGISEQTVANYEKGRTRVPGPAAVTLRVYHLLHQTADDTSILELRKILVQSKLAFSTVK